MTNDPSTYIEDCIASVQGKGLRVVFPESDDERVVAAANELAKREICEPILLGTANAIKLPVQNGVVLKDPVANDETLSLFASRYLQARPKSKEAVARRLVKRALFFGGMMVACDQADALVAGAVSSTSKVIEAGLMTVGLAPGMTNPSSFFLMILSDQRAEGIPALMIFADCAVNVDPDASTLADIAIASADSAGSLLDSSVRMAMLSFSTHGSAQHAHASKVVDATALVRDRRPELLVEGELQVDSALIASVAATKVRTVSSDSASNPTSDDSSNDLPNAVAGRANVLVFPNLDAGNIAYKLTQYLGGAIAIGPVLQGFAHPVCDLSRGASVSDIVASTALTLRLSLDRRATT